MNRLKYICFVLLAVLATASDRAAAEIPFVDGDRVLVLGDSITQNGQYVALTEAYLWAAYPDRDINIISAGLSGETVSGLTEPGQARQRPNVHDRLERALALSQPDWVIVCYGMNDGIYHPEEPRILDAYRQGMQQLVERVAKEGAKLILLTPPVFDADAPAIQAKIAKANEETPYGYGNPFPKYDQTLQQLAAIVQAFGKQPAEHNSAEDKSAEGHSAVERVIDVHRATSEYLARVKAADAAYVYGDGIHPPADGHLAMALGLLAGLGCDAAEAEATLTKLTGLRPADQAGDVAAEQTRFHERLLARFNHRSAAYRQAIGSEDDAAAALRSADAQARQVETQLRSLISLRVAPEAVYQPYAEAATRRWEKTIAELEKRDQETTYPADSVLFIGSSSVRLWDTIEADMAPYKVIQRGYGGARYSDLAVFAQRLITPHRYQALVVFVGNDVTGRDSDHSLEEIERLARYVVDVSKRHQADAPVLLVEVTPTASRLAAWPQIRQVNNLLREIALTVPNTYFVTTAEYYLDAEHRPVDSYFRSDRLHLNQAGYSVWGALIKRRLDEVIRAAGTGPLVPH